MKKFLIQITSFYDKVNGGWKPVKRFSLHNRINYRGDKTLHESIFAVGVKNHMSSLYEMPQTETKEQRLNSYENRCMEHDIKPFHWSESEWKQYQRDVESDEHSEMCAEKDSWRYEY
jgi:hypothetical protein